MGPKTVELSNFDMLTMILNLFGHDIIHDAWPAGQEDRVADGILLACKNEKRVGGLFGGGGGESKKYAGLWKKVFKKVSAELKFEKLIEPLLKMGCDKVRLYIVCHSSGKVLTRGALHKSVDKACENPETNPFPFIIGVIQNDKGDNEIFYDNTSHGSIKGKPNEFNIEWPQYFGKKKDPIQFDEDIKGECQIASSTSPSLTNIDNFNILPINFGGQSGGDARVFEENKKKLMDMQKKLAQCEDTPDINYELSDVIYNPLANMINYLTTEQIKKNLSWMRLQII